MMDSMIKWVIESLGGYAQVLSVIPLHRGISAKVQTIDLLVNGEAQTVVLRQFTNLL